MACALHPSDTDPVPKAHVASSAQRVTTVTHAHEATAMIDPEGDSMGLGTHMGSSTRIQQHPLELGNSESP